MAYHSAQGPRLGLTQLVQSRAQFGFYGALLPNILIWLIFLGYIVGENVLAAQAMSGLWHISYAEAMAIASFVTWLVVFFGYRIMHDLNRVVAVAALILFAVLLVRLLQRTGGATVDLTAFRFSTVCRYGPRPRGKDLRGAAQLATVRLLTMPARGESVQSILQA